MNRRHVILRAAVLTAAALAAAGSVAGCAGAAVPRDHSQLAAHPHAVPATEPAPDYLTGSQAPLLPVSGTLPLVRFVPGHAASIPWGLVSRDEATGALTVDVDDGGCVSVPVGYTARVSDTALVVAIYSVSRPPAGAVCAGVGRLASYRLVLPAADAKLPLAHALSQ